MIDPSIAATGLGGLASRLICVGIPASAGAAIGVLAFSCDEAIALKNEGKKVRVILFIVFSCSKTECYATSETMQVILCREATSADDIAGLHAADGVLTLRGGMTRYDKFTNPLRINARIIFKFTIAMQLSLCEVWESRLLWALRVFISISPSASFK